jgi:hypothetical protein
MTGMFLGIRKAIIAVKLPDLGKLVDFLRGKK